MNSQWKSESTSAKMFHTTQYLYDENSQKTLKLNRDAPLWQKAHEVIKGLQLMKQFRFCTELSEVTTNDPSAKL